MSELSTIKEDTKKNLLKGQSALVTGANSGIGRGVACALAAAGAQVIVNYVVNKEGAQKVVDEIASKGGHALAIQADVSQEEQVEGMFQQMIEQFGTIDILVNNAGLQRDADLVNMSLADWNKVIEVNLTGQFLCARAAVREFFRRGMVAERSAALGKIICMSSVHDIIPWATHCNYSASKGGVLLFMKSVSQELARKKVRVNAISPGAIKTPINQEAWYTESAEQKLLQLIPYNRVGEVEDIGRAAVWLASDESDYINGTTLYVDGGMTCYPGFATNG